MSDSNEQNDEVVEETKEISLTSFSDPLEDDSDGEKTEETKPAKKKKTRKKRKKKAVSKKKSPESNSRLIESFIRDHAGATLSRMVVLFSKKYNTPRLLESDIIFISPARDPRIVLRYMYSKRRDS